MPFSEEDKALIKTLHLFKDGSQRLLAEFPMKNWTKAGLDTLLKETGSTDRKRVSGRPKMAYRRKCVGSGGVGVKPGGPATVSSFTRQIARETGLAQASVVHIIHRDLGLKCFKRRRGQELNEANRQARLSRSKKLLDKYSEVMLTSCGSPTKTFSRWPRQEIHRTTDFT